MIIVTDRYGQLGNRLYLCAAHKANGLEHKHKVYIPSIAEYGKYFTGTQSAISNNFWVITLFILKYLQLIGQKLDLPFITVFDKSTIKGDYDLNSAEYLELCDKGWLVFPRGWLLRDYTNMAKHSNKIQKYFRPLPKYELITGRCISSARKKCEILVGVHIRHGDYSTWNAGKFFYTLEQYANIMKKLKILFYPKEVGFLVCSDGIVDINLFDGLKIFPGPGTPVTDLYSFAECNYLIGPPSTFTRWASYYGSVPLYTIIFPDRQICLSDFTV